MDTLPLDIWTIIITELLPHGVGALFVVNHTWLNLMRKDQLWKAVFNKLSTKYLIAPELCKTGTWHQAVLANFSIPLTIPFTEPGFYDHWSKFYTLDHSPHPWSSFYDTSNQTDILRLCPALPEFLFAPHTIQRWEITGHVRYGSWMVNSITTVVWIKGAPHFRHYSGVPGEWQNYQASDILPYYPQVVIRIYPLHPKYVYTPEQPEFAHLTVGSLASRV